MMDPIEPFRAADAATETPPVRVIRIVLEPVESRATLLAALDSHLERLNAAIDTIAHDAVQQAFFTHQAQRRALLGNLDEGT